MPGKLYVFPGPGKKGIEFRPHFVYNGQDHKKGVSAMSKKTVILLVSVLSALTAVLTAIVVFHTRLASFLARFTQKPEKAPDPPFTPEERESFADI